MKKYIYLFLCFCISGQALFASNIQNTTYDKQNTHNNSKKDEYYFPYISGNILTEYNFTRMDSGDDGNIIYKDKKDLSYLQIESNLNIYLFNNFLIKTNTTFKPVLSRLTDSSQYHNDYYNFERYLKRKNYFNKYDIIFEELAFEYKEEEFLIGLGKFNPTFGTAYDKSKYYPIFGTKIAENYELREKLGFYVAMTLPMLTLRGNFFYNDNTFLSNSLFGNRGKYNNNKGVANKKSLDNFSITADFAINDYRINLGLRRLSTNINHNKAEKGYVVGFEKLVEESNNSFGFLPFAEYSFIENYNGTNNRDINFITIRLPFVYKNWNLITSYSAKFDDEENFKNYKSYMTQVGIGYKFENGLMLDVSKTSERETYKMDINTKTSFKVDSVGVRLSYMILFDDK
ncbi:MAG: hypothetical protein J6C50_00290 [Rickettsiales bacterium]|nr:hypothetical protein [Rickettsiales bacterium]